MSTTTLNNSNAYGFAKNVACPIMMNAYSQKYPKSKVSVTASMSDKFKPINFTAKNGMAKTQFSVIAYSGSGVIALSMYNMMYAKNVAFIDGNICYLVNGDVLRANWKNIMSKMRCYTDGSNIRSEMTYADVEKVKELSFDKLEVSAADMEKYTAKLEEYKLNK